MHTEISSYQNLWLLRHQEAINTIARWSDHSPVRIVETLTARCARRRLQQYGVRLYSRAA